MDKFPQRNPYSHEIATQEDLDFLVKWLNVAFEQFPEMRGKVNSISIKLTGKFVGVDQSNTLSIEKVEGWK